MRPEQEKIIKEFLINKLSPFYIVVFGSTAKGAANRDSDIDIAFLGDTTVSSYELFLIREELAAILNKDVDLVDLSQVSTVFQAQIITTGKVIYCSDDTRKSYFEMKVLKEYAKLNEERRVILDKIAEAGRFTMVNDVILNKINVIERCVKRIKEEYDNQPKNLENYTKQDSIVLNIQRACEASIDLAMHIISEKGLGLPQSSRDAFDLLASNEILSSDIANRLKKMVGFRNIAVLDYQNLTDFRKKSPILKECEGR